MDISLNYISCGKGDALILLHGNGENLGYFSNQVDFFAKDYTVYAVDTRGHGDSPRGNAGFTLSQFADDLLGFMDEHSIEKAHLLGFSDGGNIALIFALRYPERVGKLILNGANLFPEGLEPNILEEIKTEYAKALASDEEGAAQSAELLALMVNEPQIKPEALSALKCKTLVIAGTKDMISENHTRLIAQSIPNSKLVLIEGGHFIAVSQYKRFNSAVYDFLNE